jgi:Photosynthesis system II assembly factor YCF48/Putative zinc-finger
MRELPKVVRDRLAAGPAPTPHVDANRISAFVEHSLLPDERQRVMSHMAVCDRCREEVGIVLRTAQCNEGVRDGLIVPALWARPWRMLRWQPAGVAAAVVLISLAFWLSTRHLVRQAPSASAEIGGKNAKPPGAASGRSLEVARLQRPAPVGELVRLPKRTVKAPRQREAKAKLAPTQTAGGEMVAGNTLTPVASNTKKNLRPEVVPVLLPAPGPAAVAAGVAGGVALLPQTQRSGRQPQAAAEPFPLLTLQANGVSARRMEPRRRLPLVRSYVLPQLISAHPIAGSGTAQGLSLPARNYTPQGESVLPRSLPLAPPGTEGAVRWAASTDAGPGESGQGSVERSFDNGRSWQRVPVAGGVTFRVVFAMGSTIWAGGKAGALFHSNDGGRHWSAVPLPRSARAIAGDIMSIQFADAAHGKVISSKGQTWTTTDGGQHWQEAL